MNYIGGIILINCTLSHNSSSSHMNLLCSSISYTVINRKSVRNEFRIPNKILRNYKTASSAFSHNPLTFCVVVFANQNGPEVALKDEHCIEITGKIHKLWPLRFIRNPNPNTA